MKLIKIKKAVVTGKKIYRAGSTHEVAPELAAQLIEGGFAEVAEAKAAPGGPDRKAEFAKASKNELLAIKADAEKVLAAEPGRADAAEVIKAVTELLANK